MKRDASVYTFRHTAAIRDAKSGFTKSQLCLKYGWKIGSRVPSVYLHLSAKDLREVVRNIYGGKPLEPPKPQTAECPKCHALNHPSQYYCSKCGSPLDAQVSAQKSVLIEELKQEIQELKNFVRKLLISKQAFPNAQRLFSETSSSSANFLRRETLNLLSFYDSSDKTHTFWKVQGMLLRYQNLAIPPLPANTAWVCGSGYGAPDGFITSFLSWTRPW